MNFRETAIAEDLRKILPAQDRIDDPEITVTCADRWGGRITVRWAKMYSAPELSYALLRKLAEHFGTAKVDVDGFSHAGCETCDYGSSYGHEITIDDATCNTHAPKPADA